MFTKEYEIKFYEVDYKNHLKESVLLNFLQDIAAAHAEMLGFGYSFIKDKNLGWFLLKYHLKVFNWPKNIDKIFIKTWPRGVYKLSCIRDFEVYSPDGEKIAAVSSSWVLIDIETKRITQPYKILQPFETSDDKAIETDFPKIPELTSIDLTKEFEVRYDDIDINQHVNNANYLSWALETLNFDFRANHKIEELEIQYKKELRYGSNVVSMLEFDKKNNTTVHSLKSSSTGDALCSIRIKWAKTK